jgi:hypothetical protein
MTTSVSVMPAWLLVVRDYLDMNVRIFLTRRKLRKKRSVGWRRCSNEYLYGCSGSSGIGKSIPCQVHRHIHESSCRRNYDPLGEDYWAGCLRENLIPMGRGWKRTGNLARHRASPLPDRAFSASLSRTRRSRPSSATRKTP